MPMNGTPAARAQRASSTVSPTYQSLRPGFVAESSAVLPARLGAVDVIGADDRIEAQRTRETLERNVGLIAQPAGENRQLVTRAQTLEQSRPAQTSARADQSVAVLAEENLVESVDHVVVVDFASEVRGDLLRQRPVVVPAALILIFLNQIARNRFAGEMPHGLHDRFAIGFRDLHQHAVHVEHDHRVHQISSSSSRKRSICARVPTVTRTQPGIS